MRRLLIELLTAAAVVAVPIMLSAQEPPRAGRPDPESVFKRLDVNKDGVITPDELPPGMPERMKQLFVQGDKNNDKKSHPR